MVKLPLAWLGKINKYMFDWKIWLGALTLSAILVPCPARFGAVEGSSSIAQSSMLSRGCRKNHQQNSSAISARTCKEIHYPKTVLILQAPVTPGYQSCITINIQRIPGTPIPRCQVHGAYEHGDRGGVGDREILSVWFWGLRMVGAGSRDFLVSSRHIIYQS